MSSIFTKIINKEIPAQIIYEDEYTVAFLDAFPVHNGHVLVVPKNEKANMFESSEEDMNHVFATVRKLGPIIQKITNADGLNVTSNIGEAAGQSVFHTHVHIVPRFKDDGLKMWPQKQGDPEELEKIANQIRSVISTEH